MSDILNPKNIEIVETKTIKWNILVRLIKEAWSWIYSILAGCGIFSSDDEKVKKVIFEDKPFCIKGYTTLSVAKDAFNNLQ